MISSSSEGLAEVLWHFLAGLAVYFGSLSDAQVRYAALGTGRAVDDPEDPWPMAPRRGPCFPIGFGLVLGAFGQILADFGLF